MKKAKQNVLGNVTPIMRQAALILLREGAHTITRAKIVLRESRLEMNPGPFTTKNDLPLAFELAEQIRKRQHLRRQRNTDGYPTEWYGFHRRAPQTRDQERLRDERRRLANRLTAHLVCRLDDLRNPLVLAAAKKVMKHGASGGSRFNVWSQNTPWYGVVTVKDWSQVNKGKDNWASLVDEHTITVTPSWLRIHKLIGKGDGTVDGRFLLHARLFLEAGERCIWEAKLVRTGRGFSAVVEDVWLSCYGRDVTVHRDLKKCLGAPPPDSSIVLPCEDEQFLAQLVA